MKVLHDRVSPRIAIPITALLMFGGCTQTGLPPAHSPAATFIAGAGPAKPSPMLSPVKALPSSLSSPVRVALLQDLSRSIGWTATPRASWSDLELLIPTLARRGGELAVGAIGDREEPLVRLRLEPLLATEPPAPTEISNNPFARAEQLQAYERDLTIYKSAVEQWRSSTSERVDVFRKDTARIFGRPANAPSTDVWSAVALASVFLHEPQSASQTTLRRWVVAITDGRDTAHRQPITIPSDTRLIVVTSTREVGVLDRFRPLRFTSVSAALAWIAKEESQ